MLGKCLTTELHSQPHDKILSELKIVFHSRIFDQLTRLYPSSVSFSRGFLLSDFSYSNLFSLLSFILITNFLVLGFFFFFFWQNWGLNSGLCAC
jgi:hypothetical protein